MNAHVDFSKQLLLRENCGLKLVLGNRKIAVVRVVKEEIAPCTPLARNDFNFLASVRLHNFKRYNKSHFRKLTDIFTVLFHISSIYTINQKGIATS